MTESLSNASNFFGREQPPDPNIKKRILSTLNSLHISCGVNCLEVTKRSDDFIGICVLCTDGKQLIQDRRGRRVKSGYIFAETSRNLQTPSGQLTYHRQVYNLIFSDIENKPNVVIVGFAQQNRKLKGTSGTFNSENFTNLIPGQRRECLFSYRTLIFGAIIMHKLQGARNTTPHSACYCLCLFLIVKKHGDREDLQRFPVGDIELDNQEVFLEEMCGSFGVAGNIRQVAFHYENLSRFTRWGRAKWAMKQQMEGLKADMSADDFNGMMRGLVDIYPADSFIGYIIYLLARIFDIWNHTTLS